MSFALTAYRMAATALFPMMRGKLCRKYRDTFAERCGAYAPGKLDALAGRRVLWVHAVSVGEVQAASPLVSLAAGSGGDLAVLLSTVTETGAANARNLMGEDLAEHIYAPWDVPQYAHYACDALHPTAYVTVETEVWPNLLTELKYRGVPAFMLNGRVSDRTIGRTATLRNIMGEAYNLFTGVMARSEEDARRLVWLGVDERKIRVFGDCKVDAILARRDAATAVLPALRHRLRLENWMPCYVAGSTHPGEEEVVLDAFVRLLARGGNFARARLLIAPRHPERAPEVAERARRVAGTAYYSLLGADGAPDSDHPSIVVVDEIGLLFPLYGLATAAFIGGSLVPKGGQNILEPACWGIPILHGPHMEDFPASTQALDEAKSAYNVNRSAEMEKLWTDAYLGRLPDPAVGSATWLAERAGASLRSWKYLEPLVSAFPNRNIA